MNDINISVVDAEVTDEERDGICQIGVVRVENGRITARWKSYVNPEQGFDPCYVAGHGITPELVRDAPCLPDLLPTLNRLLGNGLVAGHLHFARTSFRRTLARYGIVEPDWLRPERWADSARAVRRTWPETYARRGFRLSKVARDFGIQYQSDDAAEDAEAAAKILLAACEASGTTAEDWIIPAGRPKPISSADLAERIRGSGLAIGVLEGEVLVFTGALALARSDAKSLAEECGARVATGVTRETTMLVVGTQRGRIKSSKQRKAERLAVAGQEISVLDERDFEALIADLPWSGVAGRSKES